MVTTVVVMYVVHICFLFLHLIHDQQVPGTNGRYQAGLSGNHAIREEGDGLQIFVLSCDYMVFVLAILNIDSHLLLIA